MQISRYYLRNEFLISWIKFVKIFKKNFSINRNIINSVSLNSQNTVLIKRNTEGSARTEYNFKFTKFETFIIKQDSKWILKTLSKR